MAKWIIRVLDEYAVINAANEYDAMDMARLEYLEALEEKYPDGYDAFPYTEAEAKRLPKLKRWD